MDRSPVANAAAQAPPVSVPETARAATPVRKRVRAGWVLRGPFQNSRIRPMATAASAETSRMMYPVER